MYFAPSKCKVLLQDWQELLPELTLAGELLEVVDKYRDRARRQRPPTRIEPIITEESLSEQFEAIEQQCNAYTDLNTIQTAENNLANVPYNLRRKHAANTTNTTATTATTNNHNNTTTGANNNNNNLVSATATQRQQSSLPIEVPPPPPFRLSPPPPPAPISSNTRSNELNTIHHDDENSLENSYDDFMDIVFNEVSDSIIHSSILSFWLANNNNDKTNNRPRLTFDNFPQVTKALYTYAPQRYITLKM
ncbi:unnamed protein product [Trichobilharzia regenti]|nr:unnamed protein product [Trichobilharzia regenti]